MISRIKVPAKMSFCLIKGVLIGGLLASGGKAFAEAPPAVQGTLTQITPARTAQEMLQEWEAWVRDHAYRLETIQPSVSPGEDDFEDLQMLKPLLYDKRFVFLGESSHGVAEFNLAKTRLIQFLHQEMGYNVLAFESGLANTAMAYGQVGAQTPEQTMKDAIFGVWWSKETLPLFQYIQSTQQTDQPLVLTGFNMQLQPPLLDGSWLSDKAAAERLQQSEKKLAAYASGSDLNAYRKEKAGLLNVYRAALKDTQSAESQARLKKLYPDHTQLPKLLERSLNDRLSLVKEYVEISIRANQGMAEGDYTWFMKSMEWRDQAMADHLMWLAEEVYPTEKFVIWGHNDHIRKAQSKVIGSPYPVQLMGELLPGEVKQYSYVLGLYPASGKTADNTGEVHDVQPLEPGSIESILSASASPYTFIDMRYRDRERGNSWMYEPRFAYSWGMIPESLRAQEQYDGILLIDNVHPPQYLRK